MAYIPRCRRASRLRAGDLALTATWSVIVASARMYLLAMNIVGLRSGLLGRIMAWTGTAFGRSVPAGRTEQPRELARRRLALVLAVLHDITWSVWARLPTQGARIHSRRSPNPDRPTIDRYMSPLFTDDAFAEVKSKVDLVKVVQEHLRLTKRNKGAVGLCPFHQEDSPSFKVNPQMQTWYCFGCERHLVTSSPSSSWDREDRQARRPPDACRAGRRRAQEVEPGAEGALRPTPPPCWRCSRRAQYYEYVSGRRPRARLQAPSCNREVGRRRRAASSSRLRASPARLCRVPPRYRNAALPTRRRRDSCVARAATSFCAAPGHADPRRKRASPCFTARNCPGR